VSLTRVPFFVAFIIGIAVAAAVGMLFEVVFVRRFFEAPRGRTHRLHDRRGELPRIDGAEHGRSPPNLSGPLRAKRRAACRNPGHLGRLPFKHFHFSLAGNPTAFGFPHLFAIGIAIVALLGVAAFIRYTRLGVAIRALAENSERASLLGISVGSLSVVIWAIAGGLSGIGATMVGLLGNPASSLGFVPELLLPALAAAVIARMTSIWLAGRGRGRCRRVRAIAAVPPADAGFPVLRDPAAHHRHRSARAENTWRTKRARRERVVGGDGGDPVRCRPRCRICSQ